MTSISEITGILTFSDDAWEEAGPNLAELATMFDQSRPAADNRKAVQAVPFLVTLTFAERQAESPLTKFKKALGPLLGKLAALRAGGAVAAGGPAGVLVEFLHQLLAAGGQDAEADEAARAIRQMDEEGGGAFATEDQKLPTWTDFLALVQGWRDTGVHDFADADLAEPKYRAFVEELRSKANIRPAPEATGTFELNQLVGWLRNGLQEGQNPFFLRGTWHNYADYAPGARLDVLGPDGSQLATEYLEPAKLRRQLKDSEIQVEIAEPADLLRALRGRDEDLATRAKARLVRGRIWRSDGVPLGGRSLAIFAPPAFACEVDPCCGGIVMKGNSGCCEDGSVPRLIEAPVALAITETDEAGYFDFTYSEPALGPETETVLINISGAQASLTVQLEPVLAGNPPAIARHRFPDPLLIPCDGELLAPVPPRALEFDATDLDDEEGCKGLQLDQSSRTLEEYEHLLFLRTSDPAVTVLNQPDLKLEMPSADVYFRARLDRKHPVIWDKDAGLAQAQTIAHGRILTFKQTWRADGYSLGDLLYSLPLAPLQKKNIAVIDWGRSETIRFESVQENLETFSNQLTRDRDISEIVRSTLAETMRGSSSSGSRSSSGSSGLLGSIFGGSSGGGSTAWSTAAQDSSRTLATNFLNQLRDRTNQAANSFRSQRVTTVQQVDQSERSTATSETVANRNACHAITIQYFEVLRHFRVDYELSAVREALFVPLPITDFDEEKALRWRPNVERYLPDPELLRGMESLSRLFSQPAFAYPSGSYADQPVQHVWGELVVTALTPLPDQLRTAEQYATVQGYELLDDYPSEMNQLPQEQGKRGAWFEERIAPLVLKRLASSLGVKIEGTSTQNPPAPITATASLSVLSTYSEDGQNRIRLRVAADVSSLGLTRANLSAVRVETTATWPSNWPFSVTELDLRYLNQVMEHRLLSTQASLGELNWAAQGGTKFVRFTTPTEAVERRNPKTDDEAEARRLIDHLNQHLEFYHKAIWWTMDPDRRFALLDGFVAPNSGGRSVASVVENRLVGIVGNSLVMPVAPGTRLDLFDESVSRAERDESRRGNSPSPDLLALYRPSIANPSTRISVPTRGVFAESVIGGCNGCEKIDDNRNWRYWEHPLPDQPTEIEPLSTASRGAQVPFSVPPIANSQIKQSELNAPSPSDLERIISILGAADTFRDLAGLAGTQSNARDALRASYETTQKAYEIATNALIEGAKAAASAYTGVPVGDASKLKSVIAKDVKAGRITPEQGRDSISRINEVMTEALGGRSPKTLLEHPDVAGAIGAAAIRGAPMKLERGDTKLDVGPAPEVMPMAGRSRLPWPLRLLTPSRAEAATTTPFSFKELSEAYPQESQPALFAKLGGEWPSKVGNADWENTCAVRISIALKKVGVTIPREYREAMEGNGSPLIIKVATLDRFLTHLLGPPSWYRTKRNGEIVHPPAQTGIITYRARLGLATGHFDLWTGSDFIGPAGAFGDMATSTYVALWAVP